jgi:hypothetical protein
MADVKTIELRINTNIPDSAKKVEELKNSLKGATSEADNFNNATEKTSKFGDLFGQLKQGAESLIPGLKGASGAADGLGKQFLALVANPIGLIITGIVVSLKFLYESFQSSVEGGKQLKAAWAALEGIGTQVKDAVFGLGRALIDVTAAAYKFITLDFKGAAESMKNANKEAATSYGQLAKAVDGTTGKILYNLERQQQANDKARRAQDLTQAKTNLLLIKSRETLSDETASLKDKRIALEEVTKAELASSKEKERIALKDLQIAKVRAKTLGGEEEKKAKKELIKLETEYINAQAENSQTGFKLNKQKKMLNRQEIADGKAAADELKAKQKEQADTQKAKDKEISDSKKAHLKEVTDYENNLRKTNEDLSAKTDQEKLDLAKKRDEDEINRIAKTTNEKENLQALLNEKYFNLQLDLDAKEKKAKDDKAQADLVAKEATNLTIANDTANTTAVRLAAIKEREDAEKDIIFKSQDEKTAYEKANAEARKKISEEEAATKAKNIQAVSDLLGNVANLLGEETEAGKVAAIAQATISTYQSAVKSYDSLSGIPVVGPALGAVAAGVAVASGMANVKKIISVKTPNGGGSGGSAPTAPTIPSAPPSFNVVGTSGQNQIAQSLGNQPPVKAFVVSNDVTTAQSLDRNIVNTATIGN